MIYGNAALFEVSGPLIAPPPVGSVRAGQYLKGFQKLVRKLGGDWSTVLAENDIDSAAARDYDYPLRWTSAIALLESCSRKFNDRAFGLHLAEHQTADVYGCVAALACAAPTMREGIQCFIDFVPLLHSPGAAAELVVGKQFAELRWMPSPDFSVYEQANHHGLLLSVKLMRAIAGDDFDASYATSVSPLLHCRPQIEAALCCSVRPNALFDAISFPAEHLDVRREAANPILFALIASYLSQLLRRDHQTLVEQVGDYVNLSLRFTQCTIFHCARRLAMSPRTLQKRLAEVGTSFSQIVEERRLAAAKTALADIGSSLEDVAEYLGYSEKSAFSRAFKRASGMSPYAFRMLHREGAFPDAPGIGDLC